MHPICCSFFPFDEGIEDTALGKRTTRIAEQSYNSNHEPQNSAIANLPTYPLPSPCIYKWIAIRGKKHSQNDLSNDRQTFSDRQCFSLLPASTYIKLTSGLAYPSVTYRTAKQGKRRMGFRRKPIMWHIDFHILFPPLFLQMTRGR